jgi:hypothetical protein
MSPATLSATYEEAIKTLDALSAALGVQKKEKTLVSSDQKGQD